MNAIEPEKPIRKIQEEIYQMMQTNPADCLTFNLAMGRTGTLYNKMHPESLQAFQLNIAAIHQEAGCDLLTNHPAAVV